MLRLKIKETFIKNTYNNDYRVQRETQMLCPKCHGRVDWGAGSCPQRCPTCQIKFPFYERLVNDNCYRDGYRVKNFVEGEP